MKFHSISHPPKLGEAHKNSGEILVDTGGLQSLQTRVETYLISGLRLEAERYRATFDTTDDGAELLVPRARRPNYDLVDAMEDLDSLKEKYMRAQEAAAKIRNEKLEKMRQDHFAGAVAAAVEAEKQKTAKNAAEQKKNE